MTVFHDLHLKNPLILAFTIFMSVQISCSVELSMKIILQLPGLVSRLIFYFSLTGYALISTGSLNGSESSHCAMVSSNDRHSDFHASGLSLGPDSFLLFFAFPLLLSP